MIILHHALGQSKDFTSSLNISGTMSVDTYNFKCPKCGHAERQSEGMSLFSDECFTMLQCPQCHKVSTEELSEVQIINKDYSALQNVA